MLGIARTDGVQEVAWIVDKVLGLRIFQDAEDKMNLSVRDAGGDVLVVSQFTLYGDARKGRRPSFIGAAQGDFAEGLYRSVLAGFRDEGVTCEAGVFGASMNVSLVNEGPVTILLDSAKTF